MKLNNKNVLMRGYKSLCTQTCISKKGGGGCENHSCCQNLIVLLFLPFFPSTFWGIAAIAKINVQLY